MKQSEEFLFHFESYIPAIRFHITRRLLQRNWQKTKFLSQAIFSDENLILDDFVSEYFEHKHLLAQLVNFFCPKLIPESYYIDDYNFSHVLSTVKQNGQKWIFKPSLLNNGDYIKLFNSIDEVWQHYSTNERMGGPYVLQRYIDNPHLVDGRKYTFRVHAVLTNYDGIFFYNHGYLNMSRYPFEKDAKFDNRKVHVTNYILDGELAHIEQRSTHNYHEFEKVYSQMCDIVKQTTKALLTLFPKFLTQKQKRIFEIFGFDFMVDDTGKCLLLEINHGPDFPMIDDHPLNEILWEPFWQNIVDSFVIPCAFNVDVNKIDYRNFIRISPKVDDKISIWRKFLALKYNLTH